MAYECSVLSVTFSKRHHLFLSYSLKDDHFVYNQTICEQNKQLLLLYFMNVLHIELFLLCVYFFNIELLNVQGRKSICISFVCTYVCTKLYCEYFSIKKINNWHLKIGVQFTISFWFVRMVIYFLAKWGIQLITLFVPSSNFWCCDWMKTQ